ncbi:glutaredoxin family protein [Pseudonocardia sp. MH-G8]|uniref:glutaredoxin family protein n=1 Tax=Pseudonocardia sp. MH-G8 TaxID=1854588 RepID=UPI000B9FC400|nr:glutaredoxin family protein [Pseudonocardia sp. MH-G8]OZM76378.1 thioredoxin family protein [Pseudonocardia sp. MH-G8]
MSRPVEITLLTQPDCAFCDVAKQILVRVGDEYPLHVREIDLATAEGQHLATSAGVLFAPGVLLDGEAFSYGRLSERKLRRALQRWLSG